MGNLSNHKDIMFEGTPICRGISIGCLYLYNSKQIEIPQRSLDHSEIEHEIERYRFALLRTLKEIKQLQRQLKMESAYEASTILESQIEMLKDPLITTSVEKAIRHQNKNAEYIFTKYLEKYEKKFAKLKDSFFVERFKDLQNLGQRVLCHLKQSQPTLLQDIPSHSILCMDELSLSEAAKSDPKIIHGFLTQQGGVTSHTAVIAKSKGIPYLTHVHLSRLKDYSGCMTIIDARLGKIIVNPSDAILEYYQALKKSIDSHFQLISSQTELPAITLDQELVKVFANIENVQEVELVHQNGGEGVGLFRSEYMFLSNKTPPCEEEQSAVYQSLVRQMNGLPLVVRIFDWGEDQKLPDGLEIYKDAFSSQRVARVFLSNKEFLKKQLGAILKNSFQNNVSILFPMISTLPEIQEAKRLVREVEKSHNLEKSVRIGCMIEVPSSALLADFFAEECDFLSIGTNDLAQYVLAANREEGLYSEHHQSLDPSVIRLIQMIVKSASKKGIPVSICGEVASDPRFTPLLLGLGIREFSVAPRFIPIIKNTIRRVHLSEAKKMTNKVLKLKTASEVLDFLTQSYHQKAPDDLAFSRN